MIYSDVVDIEFRPGSDCLIAWVDGKRLGIVHTDGDGIYVRIFQKAVRKAYYRDKSRRSAFDGSVEQGQGGAGDLSDDVPTDL